MPLPQRPRLVTSLARCFERAGRFALTHPRWTLVLVVVATYANTLANRPVLDDGWVIFENTLIKSLANVPAIFHQPYNAATPLWNNGGLYRPVTTLSYAINYAIGGRYVVGYHLVNIALHVACCLLVLELARLLRNAAHASPAGATPQGEPAGPPAGAPLLGALLFAVHPVHVEAVTAMVGRAELLAALGALGCLYLVCTRANAPWRYPAALVTLALGVLSKENAAVTPLLFALVALALPAAAGLETRPSPWSAAGRRAAWRLGVLAAGMAAAVVPYVLLHPAGAGVPIGSQWFGGQPRAVVFNTMTRVMAEYLQLLVFPHPLGVDFYYSHKIPFTPTFTLAAFADTVVWVGVLVWGVASLRRAPLAASGILWVYIALLPVLNIVPIGALMGERLLYLPSVGFCIAAGAGMALLPGLVSRRLGGARTAGLVRGLVAVLFVALTLKTWTRNAAWRNPRTLYEAELVKEPNDAVLNNNLAVEYTAQGELALAQERLEVALWNAPNFWRAYVNLGIVAHKRHDDAAALKALDQAHLMAPAEASPYFFKAEVLGDQGKLAEAVEVMSQAEQAAPLDPWAHLYRGRYLDQLGRKEESLAERKRATELDPALRP